MRCRVFVFALCVCAALSVHARTALAQRFEADYRVYWGPISIADFTLSAAITDTDYTSGLSARTRGVLNLFFKAEASLETTGSRINAALQPARFHTDSVFKGDRFTRTAAFAPDGTAEITQRIVPEDFDMVRTPVARREFKGPDPFTFFLEVMRAAGDIEGRSFDGVQVVKTRFTCDEAEEPLKKKRRRKFTGPAQKCDITGDVLAGDIIEDPDEKEDDDGRDYTTQIWFAKSLVDGLRIPVQVIAEGPRGTVKIYVREVRLEGDEPGV